GDLVKLDEAGDALGRALLAEATDVVLHVHVGAAWVADAYPKDRFAAGFLERAQVGRSVEADLRGRRAPGVEVGRVLQIEVADDVIASSEQHGRVGVGDDIAARAA